MPTPCDICNNTGTDYIGRPCRRCRPERAETQELRNLERWKREAIVRLKVLDTLHDLLPETEKAKLGCSKDEAVLDFVARATAGNRSAYIRGRATSFKGVDADDPIR